MAGALVMVLASLCETPEKYQRLPEALLITARFEWERYIPYTARVTKPCQNDATFTCVDRVDNG